MLLTKDEAVRALQNEVRLVLHLMSKVDTAMLDYRPSPKQRSMMELVRYFVPMAPVQLRAIIEGKFTMESWTKAWRAEEAAASAMSLEDVKAAVARQSALFAELLAPCTDADFREPV